MENSYSIKESLKVNIRLNLNFKIELYQCVNHNVASSLILNLHVS